VEGVLKANSESLQKIHDSIFPKYEGDYGVRNCLDLVTRGSGLQMSDKEARYCFGMSKMTVKDEVGQHKEYEKLRFAEFLEFLGRIAHAKFINEAELSFVEKLERVLDEIFIVYGLTRKDPDDGAGEVGSSDESLQEVDEKNEQPYTMPDGLRWLRDPL